ncbi:uncharacterized protein EV422DRAFT_528412 [Fimicolochytrium jonesii]|uniref:uncharacterized protein n=1 Tax=Fimicolochytrium jonesii TaxID=1396493 RepID=UPI0022FE1B06|nr:uncharacterized protein EV422DRAFT_528412 [Fimicolochytrium jonesii]KAI8821520.1 hypothetical protein EV422DRAFT_528412 [Fimicolochytrium jonesii]
MLPSSPPTLNLTYFNISGRAEPIRLALHIANIPFTDTRLKAGWAETKPKTPYGQVPTLAITFPDTGGGTHTAAQADALLRYVARLADPVHGLYPVEDPLACLKIDELVRACDDVDALISPTMDEPDAEKKRAARRSLIAPDGRLTTFLTKVDRRLQADGYVLGGENPTIAELTWHGMLWWLKSGLLDGVPRDYVDGFERLAKLHERVDGHPKVREWKGRHQE